MILIKFIALGFLAKPILGYSDGAPVEACFNFRPGHGSDFSGQADRSRFFKVTAEPSGSVDKSIRVTLSAVQGDRLFKGFMMRAIPGFYQENNWQDEPLPTGTWRYNDDITRLSCFRGENNAVTHIDNDPKSEASMVWIPPKYRGKTMGNVTFVATVVENFERYWAGIDSGLVNF